MKSSSKILILVVTLLCAITLSNFYMNRINPEVQFWNDLSKEQTRWASEQIDRRFVFTGGSSCVFSINPEIIKKEYNLSVINAASGAGLGRPFHLDSANRFLRKGDVLILNFETDYWSQDNSPLSTPPLGSACWYSFLKDAQVSDPLSIELAQRLGVEGSLYSKVDNRIGAEHFTLMGVKLLIGRKLYRYSKANIHPGAYCSTDFKVKLSGSEDLLDKTITESRRNFLIQLKKLLHEKGINMAVSIPWFYVDESCADEARSQYNTLKKEIEEICPVMPDPYLGSRTERKVFADSSWHLSEEAAIQRSRLVGEFLTTLEFVE